VTNGNFRLRPELDLHPFCRINLLPAKHSKYQTGVVKRGRNAVFNQVLFIRPVITSTFIPPLQEFFFDNIDAIEEKSLAIEVCHQTQTKLQKDLEIGKKHDFYFRMLIAAI